MFAFVIHQIAPDRDTTAPAVLYGVGFALQVLGGLIVLREVRDDRRAAEQIPTGGSTWGEIDQAPLVIRARLGAKGWRIAGVTLIFIGAAVGLTANLRALYG